MSSHALRLGKIFGIEIELDYTWFVILAIFSYFFSMRISSMLQGLSWGASLALGLVVALLLFLSVLLHELGHSLLAKLNGLGISGITLFLFGGISKLVKEPRSARSEFVIAIIGPAISFALAILFAAAAVLTPAPTPKAIFAMVAWINFLLAVFNLLPGLPLDGGRILRAVLWHFTGNFSNATRVASVAGQGLGFLLIFLGVLSFFSGDASGLWLALIGWFLIQAAQSSYQQSVLKRLLSGQSVSSLMTADVVSVDASLSLDQLVNDYFLAYNYSAFPVLQDGEILGLISLSDVRAVPKEEWVSTPAGQAVPKLRPEQVISPDEDASEAMTHMASQGEGRLLVMRDGELLGILCRSNVLRLIRTRMELGG